jgi:hypothetical protein
MNLQARTDHIATELQRAGLGSVHVELDKRDNCYLDGSVTSRDEKALAVQICYDEGVGMVLEGLLLGDQHAEDMERHFVVVPYAHTGKHALMTPAQRILGSHVDLSHRLFDSPASNLRTGVSLRTLA